MNANPEYIAEQFLYSHVFFVVKFGPLVGIPRHAQMVCERSGKNSTKIYPQFLTTNMCMPPRMRQQPSKVFWHSRTTVGCECTWGRILWIATSTAANVSLRASKGLAGTPMESVRCKSGRPVSSLRIMNKRERPNSCDCNSDSESNRSIRAPRSLQSSCNSHLQFISTRGRSCMHVVRSA